MTKGERARNRGRKKRPERAARARERHTRTQCILLESVPDSSCSVGDKQEDSSAISDDAALSEWLLPTDPSCPSNRELSGPGNLRTRSTSDAPICYGTWVSHCATRVCVTTVCVRNQGVRSNGLRNHRNGRSWLQKVFCPGGTNQD